MRRSIDASSVFSNDDYAEYDFVSEGHRSLESSIADLSLGEDRTLDITEPPPSQTAKAVFGTPSLSAEDIQAYVHNVLGSELRTHSGTVRVYVDGLFDPLNAGHALQLRQAKLAFSSVHLLVGVFPDRICEQYSQKLKIPQVERCELVRHCRWVDEVVEDAPWRIDDAFLSAYRIDYVAIDEGASIDPAYDKERVKGYDVVKGLRKYIPTRPTRGLTPLNLVDDRRSETPGLKNGTIRGKPTAKEILGVEREVENTDPFQSDGPLVDFME
ncbi:hypothetical protein PHLGIDRAFT_28695 [Phlebiopsis gigantea 11061_1 CR5-6]|uniref:choline-phosphate cytidylyltransferase n=1 Tax=Phlebiopsis gigantea (strain 11061_1 CR5-6) TaxID=745531 RepID=A0A0C3S3B6_PHLG1|nr:hypothetical protein PHLGIDRAFT_28695 [Phlebiopsis gigantea 11061_1 CR5-6]